MRKAVMRASLSKLTQRAAVRARAPADALTRGSQLPAAVSQSYNFGQQRYVFTLLEKDSSYKAAKLSASTSAPQLLNFERSDLTAEKAHAAAKRTNSVLLTWYRRSEHPTFLGTTTYKITDTVYIHKVNFSRAIDEELGINAKALYFDGVTLQPTLSPKWVKEAIYLKTDNQRDKRLEMVQNLADIVPSVREPSLYLEWLEKKRPRIQLPISAFEPGDPNAPPVFFEPWPATLTPGERRAAHLARALAPGVVDADIKDDLEGPHGREFFEAEKIKQNILDADHANKRKKTYYHVEGPPTLPFEQPFIYTGEDYTDPTNIVTLNKFVGEDGRMLPRRQTKFMAREQRKLAKTIKAARAMALLSPIYGFKVLNDAAGNPRPNKVILEPLVSRSGGSQSSYFSDEDSSDYSSDDEEYDTEEYDEDENGNEDIDEGDKGSGDDGDSDGGDDDDYEDDDSDDNPSDQYESDDDDFSDDEPFDADEPALITWQGPKFVRQEVKSEPSLADFTNMLRRAVDDMTTLGTEDSKRKASIVQSFLETESEDNSDEFYKLIADDLGVSVDELKAKLKIDD